MVLDMRMRVPIRHWLVSLVLAVGAAASGGAWAQGGPGVQFLTVVGDVRIVGADGRERPAERGAELRDGETIRTGANALAQLRLADGGLLSIRAETAMKLDRFAYAGRDDRNASFFVSLLTGGFRSITGLIGVANREGYRVTTPSATIGIRGTDFDTLVLTAPRPELQMEAGTFVRVHRGEIIVRDQQQATQLVRPDQAAFIGLGPGATPRLVPLPPLLRTPTPMVQAPPSTPGTAAGPGGAVKGDTARTDQPVAPGAAGQRAADAPAAAIKPAATSPGLTSPTQQAPADTLRTAPSAIQTSPVTSPTAPASTIQTAPVTSPTLTAPTTTIQTAPITSPTAPASAIQTAPVTSPALKAPTAPIGPSAPVMTRP
jgi:hypothetical protein